MSFMVIVVEVLALLGVIVSFGEAIYRVASKKDIIEYESWEEASILYFITGLFWLIILIGLVLGW